MPNPTKTAISSELKRVDKVIGKKGSAIVKDVEKLYDSFNSKFLAEALSLKSKTAQMQLKDSVQLLGKIDTIFNDAGFVDVASRYRQEFRSITKESLRYYDLIGVDSSLASLDTKSLDVLAKNYADDFVITVEEKIKRPLRAALLQGVAGQASLVDITSQIARVRTDLNIHQVDTMVNDTFMRFNRQIRDEKAKDANLDIRWVQGPLDHKTSVICRQVLTSAPHGVPGMYFAAELGDYIVNGGHYNCRHDVAAITLEFAKSEGFEP